jgi:Family of unknown function (DUF6807)
LHKQKLFLLFLCTPLLLNAQQAEYVKLTKVKNENKIEIYIGHSLFTRFIYPDSLEKPVLFPIFDADGTVVTRGFPIETRPGDPTDHPHHVGLWLTYENVNGLDFWNNSYAIPLDKKSQYGWIKTDNILELNSGTTGVLRYHARWVNQQNQPLMEENTRYEFSGTDNQERIIDRITELTADTDILFADAKDGMLGLRLTRELQIPNRQDELFTDNKGNTISVKKNTSSNGNYLTSEGKQGDSAWGTRGRWCKVFGKIKDDSVSITIFDHADNPNYPTFWHARGYGLFSANPLGEKIFTNGKTALNLKMKKDEKIIFRYRILIQNGRSTSTIQYLNQMADAFSNKN